MSDRPADPAAQFTRSRGQSGDAVGKEAETTLWTGRYSPRAMIGTWAGLGVLTIVVPLLLGLTSLGATRTVWIVATALIGLGWIWGLGTALYRILGDHYELTSQRLKHRHGILFRKVNRIELIDIDDVMYEQGPVQAMMGIGTIRLQSSDASHPQLALPGIDSVRRVSDLIDDARREERRKRGLHIEAI